METAEPIEGGIYVTEDVTSEVPGYRLMKILKVEADAVHVRLYSDDFQTKPTGEPTHMTVGIGHMPISREQFWRWEPEFIEVSSVSAEELEGYEIWRDADGGIFG
jgi:hypothetical protein